MEHEASGQGTNLNLPTINASVPPHAQQPRNVQIVAISSLLPADSPRLGGMDEEHVRRLAETETTLPPILVHRSTMRVIDGMHRLRAATLTGRKEIEVEFFEGNEEESFIQAVRANIVHGLPLTLPDRRAAATRILSIHPQLSDRAIGAYTGLAHKTVSAIRSRSTGESSQLSSRIGADGRLRPLSSQEGRRRAAEVIAQRPSASLREVAATAGISVGTAHDVRRRMRRGENPIQVMSPGIRSRADQKFTPDDGANTKTPSFKQTGRARAGTVEIDIEAILHSLIKDPALKQTDAGRALIRWLHSHLVRRSDWDPLIASIPAYHRRSLAALARQCGSIWYQLAHELETREGLID
ncbi:ParB/RepB/Spo0J family partition protein [Actinomadura alba]|uniref:ParB N-terminal domain-containing protein n=1 Tax=Actinomadura alba TaxID=406431 RepID=A0ABR7LZQ3_9ACTN|nr:ParB/RepB/Spo0J family partition protein [Actinomadura alba]MBC6470256.1 ParB N-terminal domain-containing protein [Actinomadura alba]